jgi:hypothetical protein
MMSACVGSGAAITKKSSRAIGATPAAVSLLDAQAVVPGQPLTWFQSPDTSSATDLEVIQLDDDGTTVIASHTSIGARWKGRRVPDVDLLAQQQHGGA